MEKPVDRAQSRRRIAAAAAEPRADRDVFSNMNMEWLLLGSLTEQKRGRSIREILFSGRDERVIARYREAFLSVLASLRPGDLDFVVQSDGDHDRVQEMVTVKPLPQHPQRQIYFCRRSNPHHSLGNIGYSPLPDYRDTEDPWKNFFPSRGAQPD
jgi:hypothetical protein